MPYHTDEVILGFYTRTRNEGLKAKVIVDYVREPFVFAPGKVRVTLDYGIRTVSYTHLDVYKRQPLPD